MPPARRLLRARLRGPMAHAVLRYCLLLKLLSMYLALHSLFYFYVVTKDLLQKAKPMPKFLSATGHPHAHAVT